MLALIAVPFAISVALHYFSQRLAELLPPRAAAWLLTALALTGALTCGLMLSGAAVISLAQLPAAARAGGWSATALRNAGSPPLALGLGAAALAAGLLIAATCRCVHALRASQGARAAVSTVPSGGSNVIVVDAAIPTAYAVGGRSGRIVVSTAMLAALSAGERQVLFAHEQAHLRHRHIVFRQLAELAAAANPLLRPVVTAVRRSIERWADEEAAVRVGDRRVAARGIARAAVVRSARLRSIHEQNLPHVKRTADTPTLAIVDGEMPMRVRALLAPPLSPRWRLRAVLVAGTAACWAAGLLVAVKLHDIIEIGERVYRR